MPLWALKGNRAKQMMPLESGIGLALCQSKQCMVRPTLTKSNKKNKKYSTDSEVVHNEMAQINLVALADDRLFSGRLRRHETYLAHVPIAVL